ncbi:MAG: hypothetical protein ACOX6D_02050 [Thermoguttaceae bacterium]
MGTTLLRYGLFGTILLSLAIGSACFVCADEEQMEILRAMKIGVDEQLRGVEFKCTYTYSSHVVDTLEEAERFDTSKGRLVVHATGVLAKTKKMTYESFVLDTRETKIPEFLLIHVTVTNRELRAHYVKQNLDVDYRTLFVIERKEDNKDLPILERRYANITCPLNLAGSRSAPNFLDRLLSDFGKNPDYTELSVKSNDNVTNIQFRYDKPGSEVSDESFTISNLYPYPVLIEKRKKTVPHDKGERRSCIKALDFVELNDGYVLPQKIHMFSPIIWDDFGKEEIGKWRVTKWESGDMGKEKPKKSDFYIYLDRNSDIGGLALNLNYRLETNLPKYFDINKYGVRDLQWSSPLESQIGPTFDLSIWFRPLILLIAGALIFLGCWSKWKSSRDSVSG